MSTRKSDPAGFIIKREFAWGLSALTTLEKGQVFEGLLADLEGSQSRVEMSPNARLAYMMILPSIHQAQSQFARRQAASRDNGRLGGRRPDGAGDPDGEEPGGSDGNLQVPDETYRLEQEPTGSEENLQVPPSGDMEGKGMEGNGGEWKKYTPPYPPQGGSASDSGEEPAPDASARDAGRKPRQRKRADLRPEDFERLWEKYPRHADKEGARKAWDKAAKAGELPDQTTLMAAVTWQASYWLDRRTDPEHIPHLSTWLNRRRWNDEQPMPSFPPRDRPRQRWGPSPEEGSFSLSAGIREAVDKLKAEAEEAGEEA